MIVFFQCLGYAAKKYGYNHDSSFYESQYYSAYGEGCGVDVKNADEFASNYYSRSYLNTSVSGVIENFANNSQNTLIASFNTYIDNSTGVQVQHAVIVKFIDPKTGNMICYDPQNNSIAVKHKDEISSFVAIRGNCNE